MTTALTLADIAGADPGPAHSTLGASGAKRWMTCPGSVKLSEGIISPASPYAEEGTRAHEMAEKILRGELKAAPMQGDEMMDAVTVYTEMVRSTWLQLEPHEHNRLLIEQRLDLSQLHPLMFGTADAVVYSGARKKLWVFDYKHGAGVPVEITEDGKPNVQLMYYGLGALLMIGQPCDTIEICIVQPRCHHANGPIRRVEVTALDMISFADDVAKAATRTEDSNAPLVPGSHCRWCPANGFCPKLNQDAMELARQEFSDPLRYDPVKLAETLSRLPILEAFIKGVEEFAYREATQGRVPPGFKLVAKRASRKWNRPDHEVAEEMRSILKLPSTSFYEEAPLKSVPEMEKLFPNKAKAEAALAPLIVKISSGSNLVPETAPGKALPAGPVAEFEKQDADDFAFLVS